MQPFGRQFPGGLRRARLVVSLAALAWLAALATSIYLLRPMDLGVSTSEAYELLHSAWFGFALYGAIWVAGVAIVLVVLTRRLSRPALSLFDRPVTVWRTAKSVGLALGWVTLLSLLPASSFGAAMERVLPLEVRPFERVEWPILLILGTLAGGVGLVMTISDRLAPPDGVEHQ